jgi:CelD/BcsL family acetyltransferase involved in cellulose biosynthesis
VNGDAFVEAVDLDSLARYEPAWRALSARAAEPNVFAEPGFLLPALRRLAPRRGLTRLLVWSDGSRAGLIGIVILREPRLGLGLARVWRSEQAGLAAMLWDRDSLASALAGVLAWLRRARPRIVGVVWPAIEPAGRFAGAARTLAERDGSRLEVLYPRRRAALMVGGVDRFERELEKKRRKEWARQWRRLGESGRLAARVADDAPAIERFLALEAKGWKGARRTALSADPERLAFAREALAAFARDGRLRIHELALDDASIASGVVLRAGARAFFWKTAYDERFAEFSPGVQLTLALSRALAATPGLALVDSCALENHPMIDRLWAGRIDLVDLALAAAPERGKRLAAWLAMERMGANAREEIKRVVNRWRGRKRS